jgi:DNA-binding NarL/FixJ family response regulator
MTVVLCDDHTMFRDALADALRARGHEVLGGSGSSGVVAMVSEHQPDVCLIDAFPRDRSGVIVAAQLATRSPRTAVILLTAADSVTVWQAMDSGAIAGAVSKNHDLLAVEQVMSRVLEGERVVEGWLRPAARPQDRPGWPHALTAREQEILAFLVEGVSTTYMAERLGVSTHTVRTHVQNVLRKLGVHGRGKAARIAVQLGFQPSGTNQNQTWIGPAT